MAANGAIISAHGIPVLGLTLQAVAVVLVAVVGGLVLLGCIILAFPKRLAPDLSEESLQGIKVAKDRLALQSDRRKLQNDVRTSLVQAVGGAALIAGLVFTWVQLQDNREQLASQQDLTRRGQIADRFTRAVDQLANPGSLDVRLGGIYGLEQVARDSHDDRTRLAVYEVLTAYVRRHATFDQNVPWPAYGRGNSSSVLQVRSPDIQAVITVLGRRAFSYGDPSLDVSNVDLGHGDLRGAHLEGAILRGVDLMVADLQSAHLERADLVGSELSGAILESAHLEESQMTATLAGAYLLNAHMERADFAGADLRGAILSGANLGKARHLESARLTGAYANTSTVWPTGFNWRAAGVLVVDYIPGI